MNELLAQMVTPQVQTALTVLLVLLVILYILSIIWVIRDAYSRGAKWPIWAIVSLVPFLGVVAYCLLRPPLLQIDRDEQELEIVLKQRQLMQYGECAQCGYPVDADFIVCPSCQTPLKNVCIRCGRPLDPSWTICPYCATPLGGGQPQRRRRPAPASEVPAS